MVVGGSRSGKFVRVRCLFSGSLRVVGVCVAQRTLVLLLGLIIGLARRPLPIDLLCRLEAINGQNVHARHV